MQRVLEALRRLRYLSRRGRAERSMDDEMRHHVEMEAADRVRAGLTADEARRTALRDFGGVERFKEEARAARGLPLLEEIVADARYALRVFARNRAFALAAIGTCAVGIAAATSIFTVVHGVLLRPLPYREPDRLVALWEHDVARGKDRNVVSVASFEAWRERSRSFDGIAGLVPHWRTIAGADGTERVPGIQVSPGFFSLLGVRPAIGREFSEEEGRAADARVVVVSDAFWRGRLGGRRDVVGSTVTLGGDVFTVVGVMPPDFEPPRVGWIGEQQVWYPFAATPEARSWGRFLVVVGRLRDGVTLESAAREMRTIGGALAAELESNEGWTVALVGLAEQVTGEVRAPLVVLLVAVGLLLLMAVANVGSLTLALTRRRAAELAVRRAIGATRGRLLRQLLTQSAMLGLVGGVVGVGAAHAGVRLLLAALPPEVPRASSIRIDGPVLAFALAATVGATLLFGVAAALRGSRGGDGGRIAAMSGRGATSGPGGGSLVVAEIAVGLVLTVLAGLMVRSFDQLRRVELGFQSDGVVLARLGIPEDRYPSVERQAAIAEEVLARLRAVPGVREVGATSGRPFGGIGPATTVADPRRALPAGASEPVADVRFVDSAYFRALGIPLVGGGVFDARDRGEAPVRAVVSRATADALWPGEDAVGRTLRLALFGTTDAEVVGVVGDVHLADPRTPVRPTVYLPTTRFPFSSIDLVVRTGGGAEAATRDVRRVVAEVDPGLVVHSFTTLDRLVGDSMARDRFTTFLLSAFAAASLLLAGVGVYGVFAGDVAARRKEIGIRMTLGATATRVVRLVLGRAMRRAMAGIALGALAALGLARAMAPLLFGVGTADPASYLAVTGILLVVVLVATLIPALRAAGVSPMSAIRTD